MKNQVLNVFGSALLAASLASPLAFAGPRGGVGDGGGNVQSEVRMGSVKIKNDILNSKPAVRMAIHRFEYFAEAFTNQKVDENTMRDELRMAYKSIYQKMFGGKKTVYQALDEAIFNPVETGGCEDYGGAEHDASVINPPNVCFSLEALQKKLYEHSGQAELIALIVHEVSHLVGTTEQEAEYIQTAVQSSTAASTANTIYEIASSSSERFNRDSKNLLSGLEAAQTYARQNNFIGLCSVWGFTASDLQSLQSRVMEQLVGPGLSPVRPYGVWLLTGAILKVQNLMTACHAKAGSVSAAGDGAKVFGARAQMTLGEYFKLAYKDMNFSQYPEPNMLIRRLYPVKRSALIQEIDDLMDMARKIQQAQ